MTRPRASLRAALCIAGGIVTGSAWAGVPIEGSFALPGVSPGVAGELVATPQGAALDLKLDVMFRRPDEKNALKRYEAMLGHRMIVTVVSDDLSVFLCRHVEHVIDGHGQVRIRFPEPGLYHVYVDAQPRSLPRQVERFDLPVDLTDPTPPRSLTAPVIRASTGPYTVRFDTLNLRSGRPTTLELHITANGQPARDLHPVLGEPARAVLISASDLSYIPLAVSGSGDSVDEYQPLPDAAVIAPDLTMAATAPHPGNYRLFLQFGGGRVTMTASLAAVAR